MFLNENPILEPDWVIDFAWHFLHIPMLLIKINENVSSQCTQLISFIWIAHVSIFVRADYNIHINFKQCTLFTTKSGHTWKINTITLIVNLFSFSRTDHTLIGNTFMSRKFFNLLALSLSVFESTRRLRFHCHFRTN